MGDPIGVRGVAHAALHRLRNLTGHVNQLLTAPVLWKPKRQPRVLVLGVYMADQPNLASHLIRAYAESEHCRVEQSWIGLKGLHADPLVASVTGRRTDGLVPKFSLLNRALEAFDLDSYDYIVLSDDDTRVRKRFLDSLIGCQQHFGFAVAQPARTWASYNDHPVVRRDLRCVARQTWFVEIGPVVSIQRRALQYILPFDEQSPMGYGYDFVWPCLLRDVGMTMGIVDCCPVDHTHRMRSSSYSLQHALTSMRDYLRDREHMTYEEAMKTVRRFGRDSRPAPRALPKPRPGRLGSDGREPTLA